MQILKCAFIGVDLSDLPAPVFVLDANGVGIADGTPGDIASDRRRRTDPGLQAAYAGPIIVDSAAILMGPKIRREHEFELSFIHTSLTRAELPSTEGNKPAILAGITDQGHADLLEIVDAGDFPAGVTDHLRGRHYKSRHDAYNGSDHQQFDK